MGKVEMKEGHIKAEIEDLRRDPSMENFMYEKFLAVEEMHGLGLNAYEEGEPARNRVF